MISIQNCSYHTHTNFSDGNNSLEEMVAKAKKIGFKELGISDHLIVHKNMAQSLSWPYWRQRGKYHIFKDNFKSILSDYQKHCEEIRKLSKKENFKLYVGFEVDFFTYDGWLEELKDFLANIDYDYLISGNHMLFDEKCENLFDITDLPVLYPDKSLQDDLLRRHFYTIKMAVESGVFKFLAHLDYARKIGEEFCSAQDYKIEKNLILDALQKQNMPMEISTKGLRKIGDFYPCDWILSEAAKREISFVISDDAHDVVELGYGFNLAEEKLIEYNIHKRLKF